MGRRSWNWADGRVGVVGRRELGAGVASGSRLDLGTAAFACHRNPMYVSNQCRHSGDWPSIGLQGWIRVTPGTASPVVTRALPLLLPDKTNQSEYTRLARCPDHAKCGRLQSGHYATPPTPARTGSGDSPKPQASSGWRRRAVDAPIVCAAARSTGYSTAFITRAEDSNGLHCHSLPGRFLFR